MPEIRNHRLSGGALIVVGAVVGVSCWGCISYRDATIKEEIHPDVSTLSYLKAVNPVQSLDGRFDLLWDFSVPGNAGVKNSWLTPHYFMIETTNKQIFALDKESGMTIWQFEMTQPLLFMPTEGPTGQRQVILDMYEFYDDSLQKTRYLPANAFVKRLLRREEWLRIKKYGGVEVGADQRINIKFARVPEETYVYDFYDPYFLKKRWIYEDTVKAVKSMEVLEADFKLFLTTETDLYVMDGASGRLIHQYPFHGIRPSSPPVAGERSVFIGDRDRQAIIRLNSKTWDFDWVFKLKETPNNRLVYKDGALFFSTQSGEVTALKEISGETTGTRIWRCALTEEAPGPLEARGHMADGYVYEIEGSKCYYYYRIPEDDGDDENDQDGDGDKRLRTIGKNTERNLFDNMTNLRRLKVIKDQLEINKLEKIPYSKVEIVYDPQDFYNCRISDPDAHTTPIHPAQAELALAGEYIFIGSRNENLYILNRTEGAVVKKVTLREPIRERVCLASDVTPDEYNSFFTKQLTHEDMDKFKTGGSLLSNKLRIYVHTETFGLHCFELQTIQKIEKTVTGKVGQSEWVSIGSDLVEAIENVWETNKDGVQSARDAKKFIFEGKNDVYATDRYGNLMALDRKTGRLVWAFDVSKTKDRFLQATDLLARNLYLMRDSKRVFAYKEKF